MVLRSLLVLLAITGPVRLTAGPVALSTFDGSLTVEGELLSFDGEFFRVETAFGALTLDGGNLLCDGAGCPEADALVARARIGGTADMIHGLMPLLLEAFAEREGLAFRNVFKGDGAVLWELSHLPSGRRLAALEGSVVGETEALPRLVAGDIDVALGAEEAGGDVRQDVIALDAVLPIVAPENPRAMVTQSQLSELLTGRIKTWSRLDGPDLPVTLHILKTVEQPLRRWHGRRRIAKAAWYDSAADLSDAVASDPSALGIVTYSGIGNAVPLVVGGSCGLAIPATRDTIRAEDYPLTRPLFLQRIGTRQPKILRDLVAFARSEEAQPIVAASGYVDQAIGRIGFERQGDRIANAVLAAGDDPEASRAVRDMVGALLDRDRLTLTFRFQDGSSDLDAQSSSNVLRLADAINRGDFDGKTLSFVGFSDGEGPADGNLRLSERRALTVRSAVASHIEGAPVTLSVEAFGETLAMACDDTAWGRQVNRRVEVWTD